MSWYRWVFGAVVAVKALDVCLLVSPTAGVAWFAAVVVMILRFRIGCGLVAVLAVLGASVDQPSMGSHALLVGHVGAVLAVAGDTSTRMLLLRVQAAALYLFAGLNKLTVGFLSGAVIETRVDWLPSSQGAAIVIVATEIWLGIAVWGRWGAAIPVAAIMHLAITVSWIAHLNSFLELVVFNGLAFATALVVIRSEALVRCPRPKAPTSPR